ncbi:MAG TPA: aminotransferase class V-fold PLP-dependent enzyme [Alphaproteobacteria bacterium]|nr:aminotransferase class V-fold PLP-dependent enzyme [Alphaproteobacteria bacterium]
MPIDLDRARRETPGCARVLHLNNAGAALMPTPVVEALLGHIKLEAEIGGYEAAARAQARIDHSYDALARLLNCRHDEIAIVENATRAWDMAFYSLAFAPGDRILTAAAEYASNVIPYLQVARRSGCTVEVVPSDASGQLSVAALESMMEARVKLIAVTHVPTNGGLVNPAAAIGRIAKAWRVPFLLDACQSAGQMPLDVEAIGCDMLSATGRKYLRGPRGIGFLYVRREWIERLEPPLLDLHAATWTAPDVYELRPDARRFENWETNIAAKIALGAAVDYALDWGLDAIYGRVRALADALRATLARIPGVAIHDLGAERCGIVTLTVAGKDPAALQKALAAQAINVTVSSRASTLFDMQARGLDTVLRASVHYYNSEDEIARFAAAIAALARK